MDFSVLMGIVVAAAIALERLVEVIKPFYLQIKKYVTGNSYVECTENEKKIMTIILGPAMCIVGRIGIDIPKLNESAIIQYVLAGLVASLGSNVLHALLSIILAIKNNAESVKNKSM